MLDRVPRRRVLPPRHVAVPLVVAAFVAAVAVFPAVMIGAGAQGTANDKKVRICHATSSKTNPYVAQEPAVANNGDLNGGHLGHTGPVYPAKGWGDIIPPYTYEDKDGETQTFPGMNWTPEGQAIWQNACEPPAPPSPDPLTPTLGCVEAAGGGLLAHFGYDNPNASAVEPPPSENAFSPEPANRGQPTRFEPGPHADAFQAEFSGGSLTWSLTGNSVTASSGSRRCQGSITVVKRLVPTADPGRFDLEIDDAVAGGAEGVGDGGTTGTIAVDVGRHTVSESASPPTRLDDYTISTVCRTGGGTGDVVASGGRSAEVNVRRSEAIVCTISNTAKETTQSVSPVIECVVFSDTGPDQAVWGYSNRGTAEVPIPVGDQNRFTPSPANREQPVVFEPGRRVGVFQTPFEASSGNLVWSLTGHTATASASSTRCTATLELRKVVVPATDSGVFELRLNDAVVATGGNGTTSGALVVGTGEGTVRETAGTGTSLADYDSSVECTRNGTVAISVPGTKVDGAVAPGDVVVCTFTNHRQGSPPTPTPPPPPPPSPPPPPPPPPPSPPPPSPPPPPPPSPPPPSPPPPAPPAPPPPPGPPPLLDLVVTKTASPTTVVVGARITWTMTVTNRSSVAAADVNGLKLDDPRSFRTRLISLTPSQGTCGRFRCDLGRLAPGASVSVVAVTEATRIGVVANIVRVGSEEAESNYRNNVAAALARVIGPLTPPTPARTCRTLTAEPRALESRRSSIVRVTARNRLGRPLAGVPVRARGAGVDVRAATGADGVARLAMTPRGLGVVFLTGSDRVLAARAECRTLLGVLTAKPTYVTG